MHVHLSKLKRFSSSIFWYAISSVREMSIKMHKAPTCACPYIAVSLASTAYFILSLSLAPRQTFRGKAWIIGMIYCFTLCGSSSLSLDAEGWIFICPIKEQKQQRYKDRDNEKLLLCLLLESAIYCCWLHSRERMMKPLLLGGRKLNLKADSCWLLLISLQSKKS